jgi:predicted DNA-binding transcriptional regulator YafY
MQVLRRHRFPVSGERLAGELGVSLRTLYRDIATLQQQGAEIDGTPGRGYVLKPGFMLPPLMFTEEEIEALVLGIRWVASRPDPALSRAGQSALARIGAVLPGDLREQLDQTTLFAPAGPGQAAIPPPDGLPLLPRLREAVRGELKIRIAYRNESGADSERVVWPIAIAYFDQVQVVSGWCELREDFRNFRIDRIRNLVLTTERYPRGRDDLLPGWRQANGIPSPEERERQRQQS